MKKSFFYLLLAAFVGFATYSCEDTIEEVLEYTFNLSTSTITCDSDAASKTITIDFENLSASDLTVESSETWATASVSGTTLTIAVTENTSADSRTATITISYSSLLSETVTITQAGISAFMSVSSEDTAMTYEGGEADITVTTLNTEEEVTYEVTEGEATFVSEAEGVYTFSVAANEAEEATTVVITFYCGDLEEAVTITIDGAPAPSMAVTEDFSLDCNGGEFAIQVITLNTEEEVTYEVTEGEATFVSETDGTYVFSVAANEGSAATTTTITFYCGELEESVTITVASPVVGTTADNTTFSIHSFSTQEEVGEGTSGFASCIIDGDLTTFWHSVWWWSTATDSYDAAGEDHWVIVDLKGYYTIEDIYLSPRSTSHTNSGEIYTSYDGETWDLQCTYATGGETTSTFKISATTAARYVKITVDESSNDHATTAEFNISYTAYEAIPVSTSDLDRTSWTVECTNTEPYEGSVAALTDGDLSTYWHSYWSEVVDHPHLISVVFDATTEVSGIYMYARQTNYNCQMYNFTIETTTDGETWTELGTYQTTTTYDRQDFSFGSTMSILGFRITTTDTQPGNADLTVVACAELGAYVED